MQQSSRVLQTKIRVHQALIGLLNTQQLHKIAVKEICAIAQINRTTFYHHYGSQYDVLAEIRDWYLEDVAEAIEAADPKDQQGVLNRVTLVFSYMERNLAISRLLIQTNIDESFAKRLFSLPKIEELLIRAGVHTREEAAYSDIVSFAISGSYQLVQNWLAEEERCSPAELAMRILALANAVCSVSGL